MKKVSLYVTLGKAIKTMYKELSFGVFPIALREVLDDKSASAIMGIYHKDSNPSLEVIVNRLKEVM